LYSGLNGIESEVECPFYLYISILEKHLDIADHEAKQIKTGIDFKLNMLLFLKFTL